MQRNKLKRLFSSDYYMYGTHAVLAALQNTLRKFSQLLCTKSAFDENKKLLSKFKYEIVDIKTLDKILGQKVAHQGIVAKVNSIFSNNLNDINHQDDNCKIAILDQITDSYNIGSIIRSAAAFDISSIILPTDNSPCENGHIAKTACGALETIQIIQVVNLANSIEYLKKRGFWIIGLDAHAPNIQDHTQSLLNGKIAIVLGSEDKGMRPLTKKNCDLLVKISTNPNTESLNVSNSAAIMFYNLYNSKRCK